MIKVLHLITGLRRGGAEAMLVKLIGGLDRGRFANSVIALAERGPLADALEASGVPVQILGMRSALDPLPLARLPGLLRRAAPDVIQSWLYHADLAALVAASLVGRSDRLVWNLRMSEMDFSRYPASMGLVVRLLARLSRRPAAVIVNSAAGRRFHERQGYRPRRWETIPNGFDLALWRPDAAAGARLRALLDLPAEAVIAGMVARVDPMKDHGTFLAALAQAGARLPALHGVLIGKGTETLADLAAAHGLAGKVSLLGERGDVPALMAGLDAMCLSSAFGEGFANVLGEAMACGVPCIATDVGDAAEIVGDCGTIVPPRQPEALAAGLVALLAAPAARRHDMALRGRARIAARYGLDRIVARYAALYGEVAAAAGAGNSAALRPSRR